MGLDLLFLFLVVSAFTGNVHGAPHEKHKSLSRRSHNPEKFPKLHDSHEFTLPTFYPFEASSPEPEDDVSKNTSNGGDGAEDTYSVDLEMSTKEGRSIPILLSGEILDELLKASEEDQPVLEEDEENTDEDGIGRIEDGSEESAGISLDFINNVEQQQQHIEKDLEEEEMGSSSESEIPLDLDYPTDNETRNTELEKNKPLSIKFEEEEKVENELPTVMEDYDTQLNQDSKDGPQENLSYQAMSVEKRQDEQVLPDRETDKSNADEAKTTAELLEKKLFEEKEGEKDGNESVSHAKGTFAILTKAQNSEVKSEHSQIQEPENMTGITLDMAQRKKGTWASLLGMNPVQIRAAVDLFSIIRHEANPKYRTGVDPGQEASVDQCENFHCKRGKTCKLNNQKPSCVCQEPADCTPSLSELHHVCGTDNQTYDSSCQLFAIKCNFEGTKKGHRLHLEYTGSCKYIPPCLKTELIHFPLRMRDWLKNVLLQLYEQDFLTAKQRSKVQKIYENERRLHAGNHPDELLIQDFEKNYNMYIYPVHWQFAQMDQHPSDRFLSHSELAPLRAPLVPMEHCTSVFFHECDVDKDKLLSFREWCKCFSIKDEDMDTKLLF